MTYKQGLANKVDELNETLIVVNDYVEAYTDDNAIVRLNQNGWCDVTTEHLACTIYSSDEIKDISINPRNCGKLDFDYIIANAVKLKAERKVIYQAYLALRYILDKEM